MNTVCIATYNGEKYILEQLRSILSQIAADDEVFVSDDGSTDSTCGLIASLQDSRIRLLHNDSHHFKWNFINALQHARGEYIFLSDQDDVWMEGKYATCCRLLEKYDLVVTDSVVTDEQLNVLEPSFFQFYHSGPGLLKNALRNTYFGACMAFRQSLLQRAFPFPKTNEVGHDIWIGLVAEMTGTPYFLSEPYLLYRRHQAALTALSGPFMKRSQRSVFVKLWSRVVVLWEVMKFRIGGRR